MRTNEARGALVACGDEDASARIAQAVAQLVAPGRRVQRHENDAQQRAADQDFQELEPVAALQGDPVAALQASLREGGRDRRTSGQQVLCVAVDAEMRYQPGLRRGRDTAAQEFPEMALGRRG